MKNELKETLINVDPNTVQLKGVVNGGTIFEESLTYFEGETNEERIDDLFDTMDMNPPQSMTITFGNRSIEL